MRGIRNQLLLRTDQDGLLFVGEFNNGARVPKMDHLVCFLPGKYAYGLHPRKKVHYWNLQESTALPACLFFSKAHFHDTAVRSLERSAPPQCRQLLHGTSSHSGILCTSRPSEALLLDTNDLCFMPCFNKTLKCALESEVGAVCKPLFQACHAP